MLQVRKSNDTRFPGSCNKLRRHPEKINAQPVAFCAVASYLSAWHTCSVGSHTYAKSNDTHFYWLSRTQQAVHLLVSTFT